MENGNEVAPEFAQRAAHLRKVQAAIEIQRAIATLGCEICEGIGTAYGKRCECMTRKSDAAGGAL